MKLEMQGRVLMVGGGFDGATVTVETSDGAASTNAFFACTQEEAREWGKLLYRDVRITVELLGQQELPQPTPPGAHLTVAGGAIPQGKVWTGEVKTDPHVLAEALKQGDPFK